MSGLKNPHYYVAVFIYYFGCKTRIILIYPPKLKCVWAKLFFSPACIITAPNTLGVRRMNQIKVRLSEANFFLPV